MRKTLAALLALGVVAVTMTACAPSTSASPPPGMCSFVVGDGKDGHDRSIHNIAYPSQKVEYDEDTEVVHFVPCQPRNFEVNDGTKVNVNNERVGDRFTETEGFTSPGTKVFVSWTAYWELNQSDPALRDFYELCNKYTCYNKLAEGGSSNYSTPGWNGLLGENVANSGDDSVKLALESFDDSIWMTPSQAKLDELAQLASNAFSEKIRLRTGTDLDLFCGSGNSGWDDPDKPGEGDFTCSNVRFVINSVRAEATADERNQEQQQTDAAKLANEARLEAAKALYGEDAAYWLALQDTLEKCGASTTCVITIGDPPSGSQTQVVIDPNSSTTTASPAGG